MIFPILLIAVGLFFFAKALGFDVANEFWSVLWPLVLVVLGITMVSHRNWGHACDDKTCWRCTEVSLEDSPKKSKKKKK